MKYEHQFSHQINFSSRIYYDRFYYRGDYLYDDLTNPPTNVVLNRDRSVGEWWGGEIKLDKVFFDKHNVTAGFELKHDFRQDLRNADTGPKFTYLDEKRDSLNWAFFLQDEYSILDNLILNVGVRYDHYESFGGTVNPRVALIYNYEQTTFKALYGQAFRAPNAYERFYSGTGLNANPSLDPETIRTYELVVDHALTEHFRATVAGYFYTIDDLVSLEDDTSPMAMPGDLTYSNAGKTESMGLEFQLEMDDKGPLGVAGRIGYSGAEPETG